MKYVKRFSLILFSFLLLVVPVSANAFAVDPVVFTEAETLGATIVDLYGAVNNTSLAYESVAPSGALTEIVTLYQDYSTSASDPYTLAAIGAAAAAAGAIAVIYDSVTGQGYIQLYQEQYISSLDGYWDYQLADAGLIRDSVSGLFNWVSQNNSIDPIPIYSITNIEGNFTQLFYNTPLRVGDLNSSSYYKISKKYDNASLLYSFIISDGGYQFYIISPESSAWATKYYCYKNNNNVWDTGNAVTSDSGNNGSCYYGLAGYLTNVNSTELVVFPDLATALSQFQIFSNNNYSPVTTSESISIEPTIYIGDPLHNPLEITVPDVSDPNYVPQPKRITTTIPWNPDWGDPLPDGVSTPEYGIPYPITDPEILNDAVPAIWESIVSDGLELQDAPDPVEPGSSPSEVYVPFLPITLPSFNFSLSGIWHYVRDWVTSLGSWFTMVFTIWASLPYAIVVPVYATAVIIVVLGVYKRFFM